MSDRAKQKLGLAMIVLLIVVLLAGKEQQSEPPRLVVNPSTMEKAGSLMQAIGKELENAAHVGNLDEHIITRAEEIFDEHAKDKDFPGPDIITRPLARRAIRPIITAFIRHATEDVK